MRILSWNVQYGKSVHNGSDFVRTLDYIKSLGDFDAICLQEVARHMSDYCTQEQPDQYLIAKNILVITKGFGVLVLAGQAPLWIPMIAKSLVI